jgi:hypothetical protein
LRDLPRRAIAIKPDIVQQIGRADRRIAAASLPWQSQQAPRSSKSTLPRAAAAASGAAMQAQQIA